MTRASLIRSTMGLLAVSGLFTALTQQPPELTVTKIADDLHVIVGDGGNVAVYTTVEGVILVDDKFERDVPQILAKVKSITDEKIRYILNTHQHGDHTGGNPLLMSGGAEIVAHANAQKNMDERRMPGIPRLSYSNHFTVLLGGKRVDAHHFGRGHTNGDAFMHFPAHRVLHTGDMFVAGAPFIDYSSGGSGAEWTRTIDRVLDLDFDTVIPGHGPIMKRADLLKWKQNFESLKLEVLSAKKAGKAKDEIAKSLDVKGITGWDGAGFLTRSYGGLWDELK